MCECPGYVNEPVNRCSGCAYWREKYQIPDGQPCTENIGKVGKRTNRPLCHNCHEGRRQFQPAGWGGTRAQTPPLATTPPPHPPAPWQPAQPGLTGGDATAAAPDAASQSSRGSQQPWMPPLAATTQLDQIGARLDALEEICGRMEAMMLTMMGAIGAAGAQPKVSQAQPPGQTAPAVALAQPQPQAAAPLQAQVVASFVVVNAPGDNGGQRTHPTDRATSIHSPPIPTRRPNTSGTNIRVIIIGT